MNHRRILGRGIHNNIVFPDVTFNNYTFDEGTAIGLVTATDSGATVSKNLPLEWSVFGQGTNIINSTVTLYDWGDDYASYTTGGRSSCIIELSRATALTGYRFYIEQEIDLTNIDYITFNLFNPTNINFTTTAIPFYRIATAQSDITDAPTAEISLEWDTLPAGLFGEYLIDLTGVTQNEDMLFQIGMYESSAITGTLQRRQQLWVDNFRTWTVDTMPILNPSFEVGDIDNTTIPNWTEVAVSTGASSAVNSVEYSTNGVRSLRCSQTPTSQSNTVEGIDGIMSFQGMTQTIDVTKLRTISWDARYTTASAVSLLPFASLADTLMPIAGNVQPGWVRHTIDTHSFNGEQEFTFGAGVSNDATTNIGYVCHYDNLRFSY